MKTEIWKDIIGYEGLYQVSNLGNVKSLPKKGSGGHNGKILKNSKSKLYLTCTLVLNKNKKYYLLHRLVAQSFIENPNSKPCVNHKDGNKHNNCIENLEWCTPQENQQHRFDILGHKGNNTGKFGTLHHRSKKINQYNINGDFIKTWESIRLAIRFLNKKTPSHISGCALGKRKIAYGYIWKF